MFEKAPVNIFNSFSVPKSGELMMPLLKYKNITINHIISSDHVEPTVYCQAEDEWVIVLEGSATLECNNKIIVLNKGDSLFIPAKTAHTVLQTKDGTVWLTVHIF